MIAKLKTLVLRIIWDRKYIHWVWMDACFKNINFMSEAMNEIISFDYLDRPHSTTTTFELSFVLFYILFYYSRYNNLSWKLNEKQTESV